MESAYLLLGSNLGDRAKNLQVAKRHISRLLGEVITASSMYKTAPWGKNDQPDFYNQVIVVRSSLTPHEALALIHEIERTMGRKRAVKWSARTIDIDILLWGNKVINDIDLKVPHPGIPERKFTLVPLHEVASALIHPVLLKTMAELLQECADGLLVHKLDLAALKGS